MIDISASVCQIGGGVFSEAWQVCLEETLRACIVGYFESACCIFLTKTTGLYTIFAFILQCCAVYLSPPAEAKVPVEVPVEVCLFLPVLRFLSALCEQNNLWHIKFRKQGTRPEPQTHKHTFETYDLICRVRGAHSGAHPTLSLLLHGPAMSQGTSLHLRCHY